MSDLTVHDGGKSVKKHKAKGNGLNKSQKKVLKMYDVAEMIKAEVLGINLTAVDDGNGIRKLVVINENREVRYVDDEYLVSHLLNYASGFMASNEDYIWTPGDAKACARIFKAKNAIPEPKKFAWLNDHDLCFKRLPFEFEDKERYVHPWFDLLLDNIVSDKDIFMDFIGSIFVNESSNQNYLWAFGLGGDGKGSFFSIIEHLLGSTCTSLSIPSPTDGHWGEFLLGKRVGIFADVNNLTWTTSGLFKMLTGDDSIPVNPKFEKHFSIKPRMKFIFSSNFRPSISSLQADKRRLVFCEFKPVVRDGYENMSENLIGEAKEIINHCVQGYRKRYPKYTPLVSAANSALVEALAGHNEEELQDLFQLELEIKPGWYVTPTMMNSMLKQHNFDSDNKVKFLNYLESKYQIKRHSLRPFINGQKSSPIHAYKDVRLRKNNGIFVYEVEKNG